MKTTKIIELTKDNQEKYLDQVANLEIKVLRNMERNGKIGQLFITGKEDILEYIKSKENTVMCALNQEDQVKSAVYITQGQYPFTYNDITKYFKIGQDYEKYVKDLYGKEYKLKMVVNYGAKLEAFEYARDKVLQEYPEFQNIHQFLEHELHSKNGFDEKSELREKINKYMSEFIQKNGNIDEYEKFYWFTSTDVFKELGKKVDRSKIKDQTLLDYDEFMEHQKLEIHSKNLADISQYFKANTENSIEIDTYITDPNSRHSGLARILVYEGIKKHIIENFEEKKNDEIFLCSTLHQDNLSSRYVSEFFGLRDNLFVKRRANRDREVHICKIEKENYKQYLTDMEDKLIVLYNYNPNNKELSIERQIEILKGQLTYERNQYHRLNKIRNEHKNYKGRLSDIMNKLTKIGELKKRIKQMEQKLNKGDER